jgi:radical SAM superfamily enzyme YgiQ (UPF0313 family)
MLALSGVRVYSDELRALGMTLPGFVERGEVIASLPSLGLLTLAAHTPASWYVEYREVDAIHPHLAEELVAQRYDLVALSALSARILDAYALADALRAARVPVVLGGLHVTVLPDEAAEHADAVVIGEGEPVWPELLEDLERGALRSRYDARAPDRPPFSLGGGPIPRFDLLDADRYDRIPVQTTRGCPLDCSFCAASRMLTTGYKRKPVADVRREVEAVVGRFRRPFIELADDNTFVHGAWSRELAAALGEYPIRWFTESDISLADDDALLELLAVSGCATVLIGLEAATRASLGSVDSRRWKYARWPSYVERVQKIQAAGIPVNGCFVLGFDHDDAGVFERTAAFVRECQLADVQITVLTPFPGTALHRTLADEGRLLAPTDWDRCTLFDVTFRPSRMTAGDLERGFRELMVELYSDDETARRKRIFRDCTRRRLRPHRALEVTA